jgi:hypothetical protein
MRDALRRGWPTGNQLIDSTRTSKPRWRATGRHILAAYLLYHIAGVVIGSIPAPEDALDPAAWEDPTVQDEFTAWSNRLRSIGLEVESERLQDLAQRLIDRWMHGVEVLTAPFRPYHRLTGSIQAWSMFVAPHRYPSRLQVDVRGTGEDWRTVYRARSEDATWRRDQLDHIRMRSAIFRYAWPAYRVAYHQFCTWVAAQAADDFPGITEVRVRYYKYRTPSVHELRAGTPPPGEFIATVVLPARGNP